MHNSNFNCFTNRYKYILTLALTFTLSCAPWARSRVAISTCPLEAAMCRGVSPAYYEIIKCDKNTQQATKTNKYIITQFINAL